MKTPNPNGQHSFFPSSTPTYIPASDQIFGANSKINPSLNENSDSGDDEGGGESAFKPTYFLGLARRKALVLGVCSVLVALFMGYKASKQVSEYEGNFRILVEPIQNEQNLDRLTETTADSAEELDYFTLIEVLYSPKLMVPILEEVALQYPEITYEEVVGRLNVYRLGETKIIEVMYAHINGDLVKLVLNKIAQGYLEYSVEEQQIQVRKGLDFINEQLPQVREQVNRLQEAIQSLQQTYGFIDPEQYAEQLASRIAALAEQQQVMATDLASLNLQYSQRLQESENASSLNNSAKYQELSAEFQLLERQIALESARFGPQHPSIQLLLRQQDNLLPLMLRESERSLGEQVAQLANDIQILQIRYQATNSASLELEAIYREMPIISREFNQLKRELEIATANLTRFLETQEVLKIEASQKEIPWQLIAEPGEPYLKPAGNPLKAMLPGAIGGIFLGLGVAFALEKLENTYHTVEDVKQKQPLSILGIIPEFPDLKLSGPEGHIVDLRYELGVQNHSLASSIDALKTDLKQLLNASPPNPEEEIALTYHTGDLLGKLQSIQQDYAYDTDPSSQISESFQQTAASKPNHNKDWLEEYDAYGFMEAFRALYLNINRQGMLDSLNSLVISSALPQEGRTTVAIHLAQAAAAMGRQVLIVDAHLRRGSHRLNDLLGLDNTQGLSEYLQGKASLIGITQRLVWENSLFAIAAGTPPPDPTRLLSSPEMYELTLRLRKNFDLVIYDMPPLMGLADVGLISSKVDGVLLVTSLGKRGSAPALDKTLEQLEIVQANTVGLIVNRAKNHKVDLYA